MARSGLASGAGRLGSVVARSGLASGARAGRRRLARCRATCSRSPEACEQARSVWCRKRWVTSRQKSRAGPVIRLGSRPAGRTSTEHRPEWTASTRKGSLGSWWPCGERLKLWPMVRKPRWAMCRAGAGSASSAAVPRPRSRPGSPAKRCRRRPGRSAWVSINRAVALEVGDIAVPNQASCSPGGVPR